MKRVFIALIVLSNSAFAQNNAGKLISNTELKFTITVPFGAELTDSVHNHYAMILPKIQKGKSFDRHELEITAIKSDSCCTNASVAYKDFWTPGAKDSVKKIKIGSKDYFMQQTGDASMGGRRCDYTFYSTCRRPDKTCFIFSSMVYYQLPNNRKTGRYGAADFSISSELARVKKIIASLRFSE